MSGYRENMPPPHEPKAPPSKASRALANGIGSAVIGIALLLINAAACDRRAPFTPTSLALLLVGLLTTTLCVHLTCVFVQDWEREREEERKP